MKFATITGIAFAAVLAAGCAEQGGLGGLTTSSVSQAPAVQKTDPACATLASQIGTLRSDGIADKVEKAAAKKYKLTTADISKADQLNKANAEFQTKCAPVQQTAAADPAATAATQAAGKAATGAAQQAAGAATAKAPAAAKAAAAAAQ